MKCLTVLSGLALMASSAAGIAEQSYSNDGKGMAQSTSSSHTVSEGHVLIETKSQYSDLATNDPDNPLNGATGPCFGSMEFKAGELSGGGNCLYTDKEGDMAVLDWTASKMGPDGPEGSWALTGGSGKYEGASGSGMYSVVTNPDDGSQVNTVTGEIKLK